MLLRLKLNKPAVQRFCIQNTDGRQLLAYSVQCKINEDEKFLFKPCWVKRSEEDQLDFVNLKYQDRGSASFFIDGYMTERAIAALRNPYRNPFFRLIEADGWVKAEPFVSYSEEKVSSPRAEPILRVVEASGVSSEVYALSVELSAKYLSTDVFFEKIVVAHRTLQREARRDYRQPMEMDTEEAQILLKKFEDVARTVLPIYQDLRRMSAKYQ